MTTAPLETAFTIDTSAIKYGPGVTREVGYEMKRLGAARVAVVTDGRLSDSAPVSVTLESLRQEGVDAVLFDGVRVEPTDISFKQAIDFAVEGSFDGFVAVGGGSAIDTAKAANLYATYPAPLLTYVNAPIGEGRPVPGPLRPMIAIPTTAGTGSETTGVAIFDLVEMHAKTGIAHRALRPAMGLVDPENTRSLPEMVTVCSGLDVLCHAIESFTALPFSRREAAPDPGLRPAYQGANPISDVWAIRAIEMASKSIVRAVDDPSDDEARGQMLLAATFAGIGFGNAGVHLPHGMSYPVAGMVDTFVPPGYPVEKPMVPHGMAVVLNAPAVFRFTAQACPQRHLEAAAALGADVAGVGLDDAGDLLADTIIGYLQRLDMPNGLGGVGYGREHIPDLVAGTLPQHRVTKLSPRPAEEDDLAALFEDALKYW